MENNSENEIPLGYYLLASFLLNIFLCIMLSYHEY